VKCAILIFENFDDADTAWQVLQLLVLLGVQWLQTN
jgi:hypothetical protein